MQKFLLSLGSNFEAPDHMQAAVKELCALFSNLTFTRPIWTDPIGHEGPQYLNILVKGETDLGYEALNAKLKATESRLGRVRHDPHHRVAIDIDILQIDEERYHLSDWQRSYVVLLLGGPYFLADAASSFITPST